MKFIKDIFLNSRIFFILALIWQPALAIEVHGLFETQIVARSESAEDRAQAIKQALFVVLDRILIAEDISKLSVVQEMLLGAEHYVKQSQYSLLPADDSAESGLRLFRAEFDEDQILAVLRKAQVGIWSEIRPETLVWLIVDESGNRQFYNPDMMPDIESALSRATKLKGLPVIYPLLDIEDQQKISVNEVLGAESKALLAASSRYEVTSILVGRVAKKLECWQSEWAFYFDGKIKQWQSTCQNLNATVFAGMKGTYDVLANYYGIKPDKALNQSGQ
jgi:uncharacterized protein